MQARFHGRVVAELGGPDVLRQAQLPLRATPGLGGGTDPTLLVGEVVFWGVQRKTGVWTMLRIKSTSSRAAMFLLYEAETVLLRLYLDWLVPHMATFRPRQLRHQDTHHDLHFFPQDNKTTSADYITGSLLLLHAWSILLPCHAFLVASLSFSGWSRP
jgi:hypothetical protein